MKDMPVIFIHIEPGDKQDLSSEAQKNGMKLATYCRMILLQSLKREGQK